MTVFYITPVRWIGETLLSWAKVKSLLHCFISVRRYNKCTLTFKNKVPMVNMLLKALPWHFALLDSLWCNIVSLTSYILDASEVFPSDHVFFLKTFFGGNKRLADFRKYYFQIVITYVLLSFNISWETSSTTTKIKIMCLQNTLRPFFLKSVHVQLGVVQICTTKNNQDLQLFAIWNSFFNEWFSTIFRIFMDSDLPDDNVC